MERFEDLYKSTIRQSLINEFGYENPMQIPGLVKIAVNVGVGEAVLNAKVMDSVVKDITTITGQMACVTKAKKSVSTYKLREGMPIGCRVTLRKKRMFHFMEKLVYSALPRSREFKGFSSKSFDGRGNFTFGLKEQIVFPEIDYDSIDKVRGMDITIVTTAKTDREAQVLLQGFLFPFFN